MVFNHSTIRSNFYMLKILKDFINFLNNNKSLVGAASSRPKLWLPSYIYSFITNINQLKITSQPKS